MASETDVSRSKLEETLARLELNPIQAKPAPRKALNSSLRTDGLPTASIEPGIPAPEPTSPSKEQVLQAALLKASSEVLAAERERVISRALELLQGD